MFLLSSNNYAVFTYLLEENEVRTMVDPNSKNDRKLQELMKVRFLLFNLAFVFVRYLKRYFHFIQLHFFTA